MHVWKKLALSGVSAMALVAGMAAPASADAGAGVGNFVVCKPNTWGPHCVSGAMTTRIYPTGLGLSVVEFECAVMGSIDPASVTIDTCTFAGQSAIGVPSTMPGPYISQVGVAIVTTGGTYRYCIAGSANFVESILGPATVSGSACGSAIAIATN